MLLEFYGGSRVGVSCLRPGLKPFSLLHLNAGLEEAAEKRLFHALRFATRMPAAARNCYLASTYGTDESVP